MIKFWASIALCCVVVSGCASAPRAVFDERQAAAAQPYGFDHIRVSPRDPGLAQRLEADVREGLRANPNSDISILSLSGGGADGAFGAGVLNGWTKRGDRPAFSVVTGVSTGALIAPFAYLGPRYDEKLKAAYLSADSSKILKRKGLSVFVSPGVYSSEGLKALVAQFVDVAMIEDLAIENNKGRRLQVATTNLDAQAGVIWDIGAIATQGVAQGAQGKVRARDLVREILVASASIPGAFAPTFIPVSYTDRKIRHDLLEMHVDGSVTMPLFILPESMLTWQVPPDVALHGKLYVLINGNINPRFAFTRYGAFDVIGKSIDTLTRAQARATLLGIEEFSKRNGFVLSVASLPDDFEGGGLMAFDPVSMGRVYNEGYALGLSGQAFGRK
ncbi:patatin-like phospholipase family protein [Asticcacaulis endophyticus]|uniref:Patatin family protein n=1 Tax=Asticcacaulis endophyticus TaxID=1395890 RepID=A0A918Q582_9CAUL|nr:patatin-like phospholipase family protein [Asticcacaulis endophyticus]GGZ32206.1 patatin family protein [Asticcacaulis endophyticus]